MKKDILKVELTYDVKNDVWTFTQNKDTTAHVQMIIPDNIEIGKIKIFKLLIKKR